MDAEGEAPAPDAAEQIAIEGLSPYRRGVIAETMAHLVVAALARAGWLHDPAEVAALRAELDDNARELSQLRPLVGVLIRDDGHALARLAALESEVEALRAELEVERRSMPKVTAREPSPEVQAQMEAWYDAMDGELP